MSEEDDFTDPEGSYRRGYTHGAWNVIKAVSGKLSKADREELFRWFNNDARSWRLRHIRGEDAATRGTFATAPRQRLRNFSVR